MKVTSCPNCGAKIDFDENTGRIECEFCGYKGYAEDYRYTKHNIYTDSAKLEHEKNNKYFFDKMREDEQKTAESKIRAAYEYRKSRNTTVLVIIIVAIIVALSVFIYNGISHIGRLKVSTASKNMIGEDYSVVEQDFREVGFENIECVEHEELSSADFDKVNQVVRVSIDGTTSFKKNSYFPKDSKITIDYNVLDPNRLNEVKTPGNHYSFCEKNYEEVVKHFEESGFTNVVLSPIADCNFMSKERGQVVSVYIDGKSDFSEGECFKNDVKVSIVYHATSSDVNEVKQLQAEEEKHIMNEGKIQIMRASKKFKGENYKDVELELEELGFTNIKTIALEDLKHDILKQDNKIDEIMINGITDFEQDDYFDSDSSIIIKYHSKCA